MLHGDVSGGRKLGLGTAAHYDTNEHVLARPGRVRHKPLALRRFLRRRSSVASNAGTLVLWKLKTKLLALSY